MEYDQIKSEYAGFSAVADAGNQIKAVSDKLPGGRPHVQPNPIGERREKKGSTAQADPIETEREKILGAPNMNVIQTALFTILLALIIFLLIPAPYASYIAFLTLCVGTSVGIYLSTR